MKYSLILLVLNFVFFGLAQIPEVNKKKCYESKSSSGKRYNDWECGKLPGVVDCNEKLVFDEDSKLIVSGNNNMPFTGICETCHQNGRLERRITFENGAENGVDTTYYASGCPQVIRNHFKGQENGQWVFYFDSTMQIAWEMNFAYGQKQGKQIWLTRDGDTSRIEFYKNGLLDGKKRLYYSKSRIEKEIPYINGLMDGIFKYYNRDGILLEEINYKTGKRNGEVKYFYDDGKLLKTGNYIMDVKEGEFKTFYYQGFLQTLEVYKKGVPEGWWEERYPDEKVKHKTLYKKGIVVEEYKYDEHGNETYVFGGTQSDAKYDESGPTSKSKKSKKGNEEENKGSLMQTE